MACTLTKIVLRLEEVQLSKVEVNMHLHKLYCTWCRCSNWVNHRFFHSRLIMILGIVLCMRLLCNTGDEVRKIWLQPCRESFVKMLADKQLREIEELKAKAQISNAQPDDLINFYHLKSRKVRHHCLSYLLRMLNLHCFMKCFIITFRFDA